MLARKLSYTILAATSAFLFVWLVAETPTASSAEDVKPPSAVEGHKLAEKFCKGCHLINAEGDGAAPVGPPPFPSIANKPGQTAERIKNALIQPHPPMPDMQLSSEEINNIIAYLETLRTDKSAPPLLPPTGEGKPKFPEPT